MVKKILSWMVDVIPIIAGLKMIQEAFSGKEWTGTVLIGSQRTVHFLFGLGFTILDIVLIETIFGGRIIGLTVKIIFRKSAKKALAAETGRLLTKGFLKKGAMAGARAVGKGAVRTNLLKAGLMLGKVEAAKGFRGYVGRKAMRMAERRIKKGVEHTVGAVHGARVDKNKRKELEERFSTKLDNRENIMMAQRALKQERKERLEQTQNAQQPQQIAA